MFGCNQVEVYGRQRVVERRADMMHVPFYHTIHIPEILGNIFCCEPATNSNLQSKRNWACVCKQWEIEHRRWRSVFFETAHAFCLDQMPTFFQTRDLDGILASLSEYRSASCVQILGCVMLASLASNYSCETVLQVALGPGVSGYVFEAMECHNTDHAESNSVVAASIHGMQAQAVASSASDNASDDEHEHEHENEQQNDPQSDVLQAHLVLIANAGKKEPNDLRICSRTVRHIVNKNGLWNLLEILGVYQHDPTTLSVTAKSVAMLCITSRATELLLDIPNAVALIIATMWSLMHHPTVLVDVLILFIDVIESHRKCHKIAVMHGGGLACVVAILRQHTANNTIQSIGISAISYMASGRHTDSIESVTVHGGIDSYLECIRNNMHTPDVLIVVMTAVSNVAPNAHNKNALLRGHAIRLIVDVIRAHPDNTQLQNACGSALAEIAWKYVRIWKYIQAIGGKAIMLSAMTAANLYFQNGLLLRHQ